jgi:lysozyme family protein
VGDFDRAVKEVLGVEGGYSNRPLSEDPGGATNLGISTRFLQSIGDPREVTELTVTDAIELYKKHFWDKVHGDEIADPLALVVFDGAVNTGPARAIMILQELLGLPIDGIFGPQTLSAAQAADPFLMANRHLWRRVRFYANETRAELRQANLRGWINRTATIAEKILG